MLAAGLLVHIDMDKAKSPAHIWRFGGLDPTIEWHSADNAKKLVDEILNDPSYWDASTRPQLTEYHIERMSAVLNQPRLMAPFRRKLQSILDDVDLATGHGSEDTAMTSMQIIALGDAYGFNPEIAIQRLLPIIEEASSMVIPRTAIRPQEITMDQILAVAGKINVKPENFLRFAADKNTGKVTPKSLARAASRRPYNAKLKVLLWKCGQSFMKFHNNPKCTYGFMYASRKYYETKKNEAGDYAEQAVAMLKKFNIGHETEAYKSYSVGRLPLAHIDSRARRYAVKRFIADWWAEAYRSKFHTEPPAPYVIAFLGHVDWDSTNLDHESRWPVGINSGREYVATNLE